MPAEARRVGIGEEMRNRMWPRCNVRENISIQSRCFLSVLSFVANHLFQALQVVEQRDHLVTRKFIKKGINSS